MTNNSDGLTPTLKAQLGVGFNRALPAAFGFDNGLFPDGINDYLSIPTMQNKTFSNDSNAIEFWMNFQYSGGLAYCLTLTNSSESKVMAINSTGSSIAVLYIAAGQTPLNYLIDSLGKKHIVMNYFDGKLELYINGELKSTTIHPAFYKMSDFSQNCYIGCRKDLSSNPAFFLKNPIDELRFYKKSLTPSQVYSNYNAGIGNNPSETENLIFWYGFQNFESLDFSTLQDNSDLRLGVRDFSGNNNHAQPINCDTNPASPGYVLKPF